MSSDRAVPTLRPSVSLGGMQAGEPVRAADWSDIARLMMWVRGRGRCLVPQGLCLVEVADNSSETLRFHVNPSGVAVDRVWVLSARSVSAPSAFARTLQFTVQAGSSPVSQVYSRRSYDSADRDTSPPIVYIEEGVTKSSALTELTLTVAVADADGPSTKYLEVTSVGCWELPRGQLSKSAADLGISLDSLYPRRPIFEASYEGLRALAAPLAEPVRRVGLIGHWHTEAGVTSATYVDVYDLPIPVVPSKDLIGDTTRTCTWDIYGRVSDGATSGQFQLVTDTGALSTVISVPLGSTTGAWRGTGTVDIRCEDLTTANGVPGGTYPTVQLQCKRVAGGGTVHWKGFCLWEA